MRIKIETAKLDFLEIVDNEFIIYNGKQYDIFGNVLKPLANEDTNANKPLSSHDKNLFKVLIENSDYYTIQAILSQNIPNHNNQKFKISVLSSLLYGKADCPRIYYDMVLNLLKQIDRQSLQSGGWNEVLRQFVLSSPYCYVMDDIDRMNEIFDLLLAKGADVNHRIDIRNSSKERQDLNFKNITALDLADILNKTAIKAALKRHGAESSYYFADLLGRSTTSLVTAGILSFGSYIKEILPSSIGSAWSKVSNFIPRTKELETIASSVSEYLGVSTKAVNSIKVNLFLALPVTIMIAAVKAVKSFMEARDCGKGIGASVAETLYDTGNLALQNVAGVIGAAVATAAIGGVAAPFVASVITACAVGKLARKARPIVGKFTDKISKEISSKLGYSTPSPKI